MTRQTVANWLTPLFFVATASLAAHYGVQHAIKQQRQADVYLICNTSRISPTITEKQCDDIQNADNTEFLCNANNNYPGTVCWAEAK